MELNEKQIEALLKLTSSAPEHVAAGIKANYDGSPDFKAFKARCYPALGEPKVAMIAAFGMVIGIEEDGYTHT